MADMKAFPPMLSHDIGTDVVSYWQRRAFKAEYEAQRTDDRIRQIFGILVEIYSELENEYDVLDGDYGQPRPNGYMRIGTHLAYEMSRLGFDVTAG